MTEKKQPEIPRDSRGQQVPLTVSTPAIARTVNAAISSAVTITLAPTTSLIEVTAIAESVCLRYQTGATTANFDEFILAGTTRHYVVPAGVTAISVIEFTASATVVVIEK